jgi:Zn-dependent M28 family amino/carboxypeptidase
MKIIKTSHHKEIDVMRFGLKGVKIQYVLPILILGCSHFSTSIPTITNDNFVDQYRKDLATLSSDEFEGRRPGTHGGRKTVKYLEDSFKSIGLEPGNNGSYLQEVKLDSRKPTTSSNTIIASSNSEIVLEPFTDIIPDISGEFESLTISEKELVFVGYGTVAPEYEWDDYKAVDVKDKVVVMLRNDPGYASGDSTLFNGLGNTDYSYFDMKYSTAQSQGAYGAIVIIDSLLSNSSYTWEQRSNFAAAGQTSLASIESDTSRQFLTAAITLEKGSELVALAGYNYDSLKIDAYSRDFHAFDLKLVISGDYSVERRSFSSYNVLGLLPGSEHPDEVIIYSAHWDHMGIGDHLDGDQIFNGAADNATGTSAILNLARAFKALPEQPERSLLFMGFTAEEMGLLGSQYYSENPAFHLGKSVAAINIDMLLFTAETNDLVIFGLGKSELDNYARRAAKKLGMTIRGDQWPEENIYFRSDHINLASRGLPALFMDTGIDSRSHGEDWGMAFVNSFIEEKYHQVTDEYSDTLEIGGILQYLQVTFDIGLTLANSRKFPNWVKNDDFRPIRDASREEAKSQH